MTWTNKCSKRLSRWRDQILFESDPLISREHRVADANDTVAIAHWRRHMTYFIPSRFPLSRRSAEVAKRFEKERLDIVRLQTSRFRALHFLPNTRDATRVHCVVGKRALLNQILDMLAIDGVSDCFCQTCANLWLFAVTYSFNEKLA